MYQIITDSGANLPLSLAQQLQITVIPMHYRVDGTELAETAEFDGPAYYAMMRQGAEVQTSMINPSEFEACFRKFLSQGEDVLYVGISSGISGTIQSARCAAAQLQAEFPERNINIVDTRCASLAEGIPALRAARARAQGADLETATTKAQACSDQMAQYFTVQDLQYLRRGGRISALSAKIGGILNIKPILWGNEEGKIVLNGKVRGESKALETLCLRYAQFCSDKSAEIGIAHADNPQGAATLLQALRDAGFTGEVLNVYYEPVTGSHVGPGTVALFFQGPSRDA